MKWIGVKHKSVRLEHFSTSNIIGITVGNQNITIDTYDFESLVECLKQIDDIEDGRVLNLKEYEK